jgi:putative aldouronate transport system substrate-binding protein
VNGFLYGVATNKELCVPGGLIWNKTLADKYGIDINAVNSPEELGEVLAAFKDSEDYAAGVYPLLSTGGWSAFEPWVQGYMGDMEPIAMRIGEPNANGGEPELFWEAQETRDRVATMKEWYDAGYLHPDSYLTSFTNIDYLNAGNFLVSTDFVLKGGQVKANELMGQSGNAALQLAEVQTNASINVTTHAGGSMLGIPITSEDPARAMMYINEMHQNVELLNTMAWGVEGVHYNLKSPGVVEPVDMNGWSDSHGGMWTLGNQFKQYITAKENPNKYQQMQDLTAEAWAHESLGFRFDRTGFDDQYAAVYNIGQTYSRSLRCGVNTEAYDTMLAELVAAGVPDVLAAAKEQYAAWKAAQ